MLVDIAAGGLPHQQTGQGVHGRRHGVDALRVVLVALGELDVPIVVLDLDGILEAPEHQGALLDHHLVLEQQLPEGLDRQILPGAGLGHLHAEVLPVPVLVHPDGQVQWYDKKHLFTYGGEHKSFTAGAERVIVNFRGVRILLQVCYDLRFPVWARNRKDYDMILYVASWPTPRVDAWNILLRARAIENQCYVVAVNRVGEDPACQYCGGSAVIDPYGHTLAACEDNKSCTAEATIDMDVLEAFRKKFPVLDDADPYQIL